MTPARWLKLTLSYDGTAYAGWQVQPHVATVQELLERAVECVTGQQLRAVASGRTDAGVHAWGQVVSLSVRTSLQPCTLCKALNANLPEDIRVRSVEPATAGFHAIRDARGKEYRYQIQDGGVPDVFSRRYCWYVPHPLCEADMACAAERLVGRHDFASYQTSGAERATTVRTIDTFDVARHNRDGVPLINISITADGFLYNMVRNLVGTLVEVGRGRRAPDWPWEVLQYRDRRQAGATAPAHGLCLMHVTY